jgi:hypothetical protein
MLIVHRAAKTRSAAAIDLAIVVVFFFVCYLSEPVLDPLLRRGRGLGMAFALAAYQFTFEGVAPLVIMAMRHERFSDYGFIRRNAVKSVVLALLLAMIYNAGMSWHAGAVLWIPLGLSGLAATVAAWGFFEAFFGVFFVRNLNQALGHDGRGWLSPGALGFALFNGLIHLTVGQGFEGFVTSFASGYAIGVVPAVTTNAWGSALVQTLTNAVGKL